MVLCAGYSSGQHLNTGLNLQLLLLLIFTQPANVSATTSLNVGFSKHELK